MNTNDHSADLAAQLAAALPGALPGWQCRALPQPFSHAPQMHLRATICGQAGERPIILRRSWSVEAHQREVFVYRRVLPNLPVRVPGLLGTFASGDEQSHWMILEDLGPETADLWTEPQRRLALQALGALHGSRPQKRCDWPNDAPLPMFPQGRFVHGDWHAVFDGTLSEVDMRLGDWVDDLLTRVLEALHNMPWTLLHGDPVAGNMIPCAEGMGLIDWEHASIGPAAVDLGMCLKWPFDDVDLEAYCAAHRAASEAECTVPAARKAVELGAAHESLRWLAYYTGRLRKGNPPDQEWRSRYLAPCIDKLVDYRSRWS